VLALPQVLPCLCPQQPTPAHTGIRLGGQAGGSRELREAAVA
jgi:hypothetical protein